MNRLSPKYRITLVLAFASAFAIGLGSCDSGTAPEVEPPSLGPVPEWSPSESVLPDRDGDRYTLVQGRMPSHVKELSVSKLSGILGGSLDIGELGFEKPVTIELTCAWATNVTDPSRLVIVRILDDGRVEEVPSEVDTDRKVVRAELDHFSRYCIAMN